MSLYHNPRERGLNVSRKNCWILVARNMRPGPDHGKWQPATVMGFVVICASKKDVMEFRLTLGGSQFPIQANMTDDAYEEYLDRFIKIQPYQATGRWEVWAHNAMRGWIPDTRELLTGSSESQYDQRPSQQNVTVTDERQILV